MMVSTHRHTCISHETPQECYWHNAKAALHIFFENRPKCHPYVFGHKASSICFNCDMDCITDGRHLSCRGCIVEAVVDLHLHAHIHTHKHTYLIREKLQQEWAQKNYAQVLWIQLTLNQSHTEKEKRLKKRGSKHTVSRRKQIYRQKQTKNKTQHKMPQQNR